MSYNHILIANRGEIAARIIRTAQALGYETTAVFSAADANAPHVALADHAVRLGPPEVGESYLHSERVLAAAKQVGAEAIHPGYGFLSENSDFAQRVLEAGLVWIGPPPEAMATMGNKAAAKAAVSAHSVPTVPGYAGDDQSDDAFIAAAAQLGLPVMVKAAAGGGGRGMRLVTDNADLPAALASARSEAAKAFGSDELLLEKAIVRPRHIEVQVFGDQHGNVIHLGERDCSIQRRHQKVVEEAPSPAVSSELRAQMGEAAVLAAKSVGYVGAGTVEFLLSEDGAFYFIEMNTRLQVEHPVTEMITGQDLVAWQLQVAAGEPLPLTQEQVTLSGHSIEVRLYAENPASGFLPSTGTVLLWHPPSGAGVRVDDGLRSGQEITPFYDAMVAKIIATGETRAVAQRRLLRALRQTAVLGVQSNRRFLLTTLAHPIFTAGEATTAFIDELGDYSEPALSPLLEALSGVILYQQAGTGAEATLWGWHSRPATYCFDEQRQRLTQVQTQGDSLIVQVGEETFGLTVLRCAENALRFERDGVRETAVFAITNDGAIWVQLGAETAVFVDQFGLNGGGRKTVVGAGSSRVLAPMPGAVLSVAVQLGDEVTQGQPLLVLEAMKMEHTLRAPFDGVVETLAVQAGQQVQAKELLVLVGTAVLQSE